MTQGEMGTGVGVASFKIYTKGGDKGTTSLATGERVSKAALRIEAYGSIDELNATLGVLRDTLRQSQALQSIEPFLIDIQVELFNVGAELASAGTSHKNKLFRDDSIERLEVAIDEFTNELPPLTNFVLPGGHPANSSAHICRTVCRRAERLVVRMSENESVRPVLIQFLNRLSDYLFTLARWVSLKSGTPETLWRAKPQAK